MKFLFGFLGLVFGAAMGGLWGAALLCAAGIWFGHWLAKPIGNEAREGTGDGGAGAAAPAAAAARAPLDSFDELRAEVLALRERVARLEAGLPAAPKAEPARAAAAPTPEIHSAPVAPPPSAIPAAEWGSAPKTEPWAQPKKETKPDAPVPQPAPQPAPVVREEAAPPPPMPEAPAEPSLLARLLSGNIVAKVGVVVLFFGVGFLLKFAYDAGLMPPELRLAGVALASAALFGIGWWLRGTRRLYGLILQGGASGLAYLDVFFALKTYGFIGPVAGFALFAALGVATTLAAVRQDSRSLAVLGLGGAFLAPVLASTGSGSHVLLFSYYLLLNLFVLGVSWFRSWRELNLTGWLFTFVIGFFWGRANYRPELFASVEPFLLGFFAIYLLIPILFATRQPPSLKGLVDGTLVFGTPAAVAYMQAELVRGMPNGLAWSSATGAALYALLAVATWRRDAMRLLAETYAALAVGLGTLAVFFACDAYPTFAFWTIEGAAILWVGLRQDRWLARAFALAVQLAGAVLFLSTWNEAPRPHPVFNDEIYGCLLIAAASLLSARLLHRHAERLLPWEAVFAPALLLWGALWWATGGLDAIRHALPAAARPNASALFFLASFLAAELGGRWRDWSPLRNLAGFHPLVFAAVLVAQFSQGQHPLGGLGGLAWVLGFAAAFWTLLRQERDGIAVAAGPRYAALWVVMALAATLEQVWLLDHREHLLGMLLAVAGHLAAYLRFSIRERDAEGAPALSGAVLLWSLAFWFGHALAWGRAELSQAALVAALLGLAAATAFAYELAGAALGWRTLRRWSAFLWVALPIAAVAQLDARLHPFAGYGWAAWPAAFAVAYWALARQETDEVSALGELPHPVGAWLIAALAGLELSWRVADLGWGSAWHTCAWGVAGAGVLAAGVAAGNRGWWPVGPRRDLYRGLVLGPIGAAVLLWALYANLKDPGGMAPLGYLPLLNPVDATLALSLWALHGWSRWFSDGEAESAATLRKAAGALGFLWLNGIALRSIHFWFGVPYRFDALFESVLVQSTLSLLWTSAAMAVMFLARRRMERGLWVAGAMLLAAVVAKLFLVDLANSGTVARIVSFLGVGVLLLAIGYLAPVPPGEKAEPGARG